MKWTNEWPTERGYYWFYGWCFSHRNYSAKLHFVKVRHEGGGKPIYITDGHFLWEAEGAEGVWMPVDLPECPEHLFGQKEDKDGMH